MFVLKNAWAALGRVKWRTALIALLALLVSFSAAVDLAVIRADDTANNETYQSQKATAVIRPRRPKPSATAPIPAIPTST